MPHIATTQSITKDIIEKLKSYTATVESGFTGAVTEVADGVAKVSGLTNVAYSEMVEFPGGVLGS